MFFFLKCTVTHVGRPLTERGDEFLQDRLVHQFKDRRSKINVEFKENIDTFGKFLLSLYIFEADRRDPFIAIVANYVDQEFKLVSRLVGKFLII